MAEIRQKHFDLREHPEMIEEINRIVNARCAAEVKEESKGVVIVQIERKLRYPITRK